MKRLVYLVTFILSFSVASKEVTFKFNTVGSGSDIYPCNAGLKHSPSKNQVCTLKDDPYKSCKKSETGCFCRDASESSHLGDFMRYDLSLLNNRNLNWKSPQTGLINSSSNKNFNDLSMKFAIDRGPRFSGANVLGIKVNSLTFNLASELFGASYFIDICYKGPQVEYWDGGGENELQVKNILFGDITVTDFSSTIKSYISLAGLQVESKAICDLQGEGRYKFAHNGNRPDNGIYDTIDTDLNLVGLNNLNNDGANDYSYQTPPIQYVASTISIFDNAIINENDGKTPRFCVIRYLFEEGRLIERQHQRTGAQIKIKTGISESF